MYGTQLVKVLVGEGHVISKLQPRSYFFPNMLSSSFFGEMFVCFDICFSHSPPTTVQDARNKVNEYSREGSPLAALRLNNLLSDWFAGRYGIWYKEENAISLRQN